MAGSGVVPPPGSRRLSPRRAGAHRLLRRLQLQACCGALLFASAQACYPRITDATGFEAFKDCYLDRSAPWPVMVVPVGGKLHVRLWNDCLGPVEHEIDNSKYGYPGILGQTTFFDNNGFFTFAPTQHHAGHQYDVCARTVDTTGNGQFGGGEFYACIKIEVRGHRAQFVHGSSGISSALPQYAPADGSVLEATVGRQLQFALPVDSLIDGGCDFRQYQCTATPCPAQSDCIDQVCPVLQSDSECTCTEQGARSCGPASGCECMTECPLGALPKVKALPGLSYPKMDTGIPEGAILELATHMPDGTAVTHQTRAQPWILKWDPKHHHRNAAPIKMCFGAYMEADPAMGAEPVIGDHVCYAVKVSKCRQCVQAGDTMTSIAAQHKTDWLHIYYANPSLPGSNPSHIDPGYDLRLGVAYKTRWGDDLDRLAQRFLVPQSSVLLQNPELTAPAKVSYKNYAAGAHTQVSLVLRPRRRIMPDENISVPFEGVEGEDWEGLVSETCDAPVSKLEVGKYCSPETHAVNDACGPGLWGSCKYDESGAMGCLVHTCDGLGAHKLLSVASWRKETSTLMLQASTIIEAGQVIRVAVSQAAGLRLSMTANAPREIAALIPVPEEIWDPLVEDYVAMTICVVMPVCEGGVECLYGSDCHLKDQLLHFS